MKNVNIEAGMPRVNEALLRLERELSVARQQGYAIVKIIHGYGSSGAGGTLRTEIQKWLRQRIGQSQIRSFIPGEDWRVSDERTWKLLKANPELKKDSDLGRSNQGFSIVLL
jgi:hypothetical protein